MRQNIVGWCQQSFCFQKFVSNAQQYFAFTPRANFPAHNFHWWRWWDRIQAIFIKLFYFNLISSKGGRLCPLNYNLSPPPPDFQAFLPSCDSLTSAAPTRLRSEGKWETFGCCSPSSQKSQYMLLIIEKVIGWSAVKLGNFSRLTLFLWSFEKWKLTNYCMCVIISRGLYIFYPIFHWGKN